MNTQILKAASILFLGLTLSKINTQAQTNYKHAITLKPINFMGLDNDDFSDLYFGRYAGIEFETLISKNKKWSLLIPLTFGDENTYFVNDYTKDGKEFIFSHGIKYYLKSFNQKNGFAFSANLLLGHEKVHYRSEFSDHYYNGLYSGLMLNVNYLQKLKGPIYFNFEAGTGCRISDATIENYTYYGIAGPSYTKIENVKPNSVGNFSVGIQYKF